MGKEKRLCKVSVLKGAVDRLLLGAAGLGFSRCKPTPNLSDEASSRKDNFLYFLNPFPLCFFS